MARRQADGRLAAVAKQFVEWREGRVRGQRIPEPLWRAAARLVPECGLCRTAQTLRLDYYKLKRLCARDEPEKDTPQFVELAAAAPSAECVIELEDVAGARMRIHLKGQATDLSSLASKLWGRR